MYLSILKLTSVMAMTMFWMRTERGKDVGNDANVVGKSSDGDNGDGDNSDGFVNSNGGNSSNDVGNPPASGDAVGERKRK